MSKRYSLFCGIDIGKRKHAAAILDADGTFLARSQSFANDAAGFAQLQQRIRQVCGNKPVLLGMEATGHYWYALHDHLHRWGYDTAVLNPLQTAQRAKAAVRKCKTDKVDARHICKLLRSGEHRPALVPGELAMTCRQLARLWHALGRQQARIKQLIQAKLECAWPEYETYFANAFCATSRKLLAAAPTPQDLLKMTPAALAELLEKASRKKLGTDLAARIRASAQESVGMRRGLEGTRLAVRTLLNQLDALRPVRKQLQADIQSLSSRLPGYILTLPGIDAIRAVSLFGETDPISAFKSPDQLVAFAGLDVSVFQTGQYNAPVRHISKRGSPHLRRTLWMMAAIAARREGELRNYYLRRRREGLHYLSAVTATAIKLCRVVWRILTDKRDYIPEGRPTQS